MTTPRPRESEPPESRKAISADADDWIRQFIKHLELHFLDASRNLPPEAIVRSRVPRNQVGRCLFL